MPRLETHDLLRAFLITVGVVAILVGLFAPDAIKEATSALIII